MNYNLSEVLKKNQFLTKMQVTEHSNTKTSQFIQQINGNELLLDSNKIAFCVDNALRFLKNTDFKKYEIIFLGTNNDTLDFVKLAAYKCEQNYMCTKWVPGLLTNWKHKQKDFDYYRQLKNQFHKMSFDGLASINGTTRAKRTLVKDYLKMHGIWKGMLNLTDKPKLLIVLDGATHKGAIKEAHRSGIPTIAFVNTQTDSELVTYPIMTETSSIENIVFYLELFAEALHRKN